MERRSLVCCNPCGGHPGRLDHLRADLYLGLIDGSYTGLHDAAILEALLATARTGTTSRRSNPDDQHPDGQHPDGQHPDDGSDEQGSDEQGSDEQGPDEQGPDVGGSPAGDRDPARCRSGRLEVRVRLSTLLGLDDCPGELAGWGPVHAELARHLARAHTGGQWRFALTDPDGQLRHAGITRRRPTGWTGTRCTGVSAGTVELQAPTMLLDTLTEAADRLDAWTNVVAELRRQATDQHNHAARFADAGRRLPGAALSRHVQIRDRHCRFPTCRAPAHGTDTDHTMDYARGGASVEATSVSSAATTTDSNTRVGGSSPNPNPGSSSGPADSAGFTRCVHHRSLSPSPTRCPVMNPRNPSGSRPTRTGKRAPSGSKTNNEQQPDRNPKANRRPIQPPTSRPSNLIRSDGRGAATGTMRPFRPAGRQ